MGTGLGAGQEVQGHLIFLASVITWHFDFSLFKECEVYLSVFYLCLFNDYDAHHLFVCLLAMHSHSLEKQLLLIF